MTIDGNPGPGDLADFTTFLGCNNSRQGTQYLGGDSTG